MVEKIGPYQVEERLGVGGMGEVYKAYDDRLDRWVAIKRIRPDREDAEDNRERFQREARATAKLNHSSIVHLYDIFQDEDSDCIVMEYVEGRTLDTMVMEGALNPLLAVRLGQEIATGLAEAHSKGILHRDLKVENIIVTPEGRAKILDFGLAKPLLRNELDTSLTGKGQLVGTSRAMSPEYVSGEDIDHRSDLFSLGVLLYEAATGHSPFKSHNTLATLKQVMLHQPTPVCQLNNQVPDDFSDLIDRLLEKDPDDRPQSAEEVAAELSAIWGQLSSGIVSQPSSTQVTFSRSSTQTNFSRVATETAVDVLAHRKWIRLVAIAAVVALAVVFVFWRIQPMQPEEPEVTDKDYILLGEIKNLSADTTLDESVAQAFRFGLERSKRIKLLPESLIARVLQRMEQEDTDITINRQVGVEICQREGAKALVLGNIDKYGKSSFRITAEVVEPVTGSVSHTTSAVAKDRDSVIPTIDQVTEEIRTYLGESLTTIEETRLPLERVTTRNLEALKAYSQGETHAKQENYEDAIKFYQQAIKADPNFAMAHVKLGVDYLYSGRDEEALKHLSIAESLSDRLTPTEKIYVEGWIARVRGQPTEEVEAWMMLSELHSKEYTGHYNLGLSRWLFQLQFEAARDAILAAEKVAPPQALQALNFRLGYVKLALGEYEEAITHFEKSDDSKWSALAEAYTVMRQYPKAEAALRENSNRIPNLTALDNELDMAIILADQGRFQEALNRATAAKELSTQTDNDLKLLASEVQSFIFLKQLGEKQKANEIQRQMGQIATRLFDSLPTERLPVLLLSIVGKINAENGNMVYAEAIATKISELTKDRKHLLWQAYSQMLEGSLLNAQGQAEKAVTKYRDALAAANSFQARTGLAQTYEALGMSDAAIKEYEWMLQHRGQALVECFLDGCEAWMLNNWTLAYYRLGRLHEVQEQFQEARESYQAFLNQWFHGQDLALYQDAKKRLEDLGSP